MQASPAHHIRFIAVAERGKNSIWLVVATIVAVFGGYFLGQIPFAIVLFVKSTQGAVTSSDITAFQETMDFDRIGLNATAGLILMIASFFFALVMLYLFLRYVHQRPFRTLITPDIRIRYDKILFSLGFWFILTAALEVVMFAIAPRTYEISFEINKWIPLLLVSVFLIPIQTSFEELFCRGYLLQIFGLWFRTPVPGILLTALIFGFLHIMNPEIQNFGFGIMMLYYISVGIFLAVITLMDDGLELALGVHAATNIYGAAFVGFEGSAIQTDTPVKMLQIDPYLMVGFFFLMLLIYLIVVARKYRWEGWQKLYTASLSEAENDIIENT